MITNSLHIGRNRGRGKTLSEREREKKDFLREREREREILRGIEKSGKRRWEGKGCECIIFVLQPFTLLFEYITRKKGVRERREKSGSKCLVSHRNFLRERRERKRKKEREGEGHQDHYERHRHQRQESNLTEDRVTSGRNE